MKKILIVDDSVFSQKMTSNLIRKYISDIDIYYANDGQDGYIKYKEIKPDYIFLDLLMPKVGGIELIGMIKEYDENAKIIVLSADVQKNIHEEIEALNVMMFINKPLNDDKAKLICEMIGRKV